MSKPQIDMIKADAYRQLTAQDVAELLKRKDCVLDHVSLQVERPVVSDDTSSSTFNLASVPEHLF